MIASLRGKVDKKADAYIILNVGGVGYKVFVINRVIEKAVVGEELYCLTHQHVREDILDLYGFEELDELELFSMLLSISGVGPRSALSVLDVATIDDLKAAISADNPALLKQVAGIGPKLAERITLELKNKLAGSAGTVKRLEKDIDVIEGLLGLGYSRSQAQDAVKDISKDISDSGERMKAALKKLAK